MAANYSCQQNLESCKDGHFDLVIRETTGTKVYSTPVLISKYCRKGWLTSLERAFSHKVVLDLTPGDGKNLTSWASRNDQIFRVIFVSAFPAWSEGLQCQQLARQCAGSGKFWACHSYKVYFVHVRVKGWPRFVPVRKLPEQTWLGCGALHSKGGTQTTGM
jgi:hypothetical protein